MGGAKANARALRKTRAGRNKILSGDCFTVVQDFDAIVDQMTVPVVQGMLKYAFKSDPKNELGSCTSGKCDKEWAEGWAFAAAVLPRLHYCSFAVAEMVRANLDTANAAPMRDGFAALKTEVESVYTCLGITCADVGEFQNSAGVYAGMEACTDTGAASGNEELDCPVAGTGSSAAPEAAAAETTEAPSSGNEDDTKDKEDKEKEIKKVVDTESGSYRFAALFGLVLLLNA